MGFGYVVCHDLIPRKSLHHQSLIWTRPSSCGQHGTHLGPVGPRWAPCWPHEPCFQGPIISGIRVHGKTALLLLDYGMNYLCVPSIMRWSRPVQWSIGWTWFILWQTFCRRHFRMHFVNEIWFVFCCVSGSFSHAYNLGSFHWHWGNQDVIQV